ncbi:MAG: flagellar biosynthesis anti-sigma factor FlgM [Desulfobacteraceae bacterium]|nr:flagellar biosynthesis anti-sigma factor FlgM [Desulfobacteraceae bacterium]
MKISIPNSSIVKQTYGNQKTAAPHSSDKKSETGGTRNVDNVNFSSETKDLQKIQQSMEKEPAGRAERIAALKEQIETGKYTVDADKIAEKMTGFFLDKIA